MKLQRIVQHPILGVAERQQASFLWNGKPMSGYAGEMLSSALFANGIQTFGHHPKGLRKIEFRIKAPGFGSGLFDLSSAKPQE